MTDQSTQTSNTPTRVFYAVTGWQRLVATIGFPFVAVYGFIQIAALLALPSSATTLSQVSYGIIVWFLIAAAFVYVAYKSAVTRWVVTPQNIVWHSGYFSVTTTWNNVEQIEETMPFLVRSPQIYLRLRGRPPIKGILGQLMVKKPYRINIMSGRYSGGLYLVRPSGNFRPTFGDATARETFLRVDLDQKGRTRFEFLRLTLNS